ncbi:MAG: alpha/beta fold hydrolase, partial [Gemmatimonadales bacterium]
AIAETMLPKLLAASTLSEQPEIVERVRQMILRTPVAGIVGALAAMRDRPDSESLLPTLGDIPTLVVVGEADTVTPPEQAEAMARAIPGAQLAVIRGAGHLSPLERPDEVSRRLAQFVGELG